MRIIVISVIINFLFIVSNVIFIFCIECKSSHIGHSFINFEDIKIDNEDITKAIIIIKQNISSLYREYFSKNKNIDENLYKNEIIRFAWFILRKYKREKIIFLIFTISFTFSN